MAVGRAQLLAAAFLCAGGRATSTSGGGGPVQGGGAFAGASDPLAQFTKYQRQVLAWASPVGRMGGWCGAGTPTPCNLTSLALECLSTPTCTAFNTDAYLFACPGGRCDCDAGNDVCMRGLDIFSSGTNGYGCDHADTYVLSGAPPPPEFAAGVADGTILWGSPEPRECFVAEVGNGYMAAGVTYGALHVSGLFNGACGGVYKARLPSPVAVALTNATVVGGALDTRTGVYRRRHTAVSAAGSVVRVEVRQYMHRVRRNVAVVEVAVLDPLVQAGDSLSLAYETLWAPTPSGRVPADGHIPGDGCAGGFAEDLVFVSNGTVGAAQLSGARTTARNDDGELFNVTFLVELAPASGTGTLTFLGGGGGAAEGAQAPAPAPPPPQTFLSVVATSLDTMSAGGGGDSASVEAYARGVYAAAVGVGGAGLFVEHSAAWASLNAAGLEVTPAMSDDPGVVARARDIAEHFASSFYYLASSIRPDWPTGVSPGGIASNSYQGAVFMDMDFWMMPSLYFLSPPLAEALVEYRYVSVASGTEAKIAALFGYNGTMSAWTAGYQGALFGCCSGHGEYEDCLEQHVTGDKAWAAWQYYSATGNTTWLASRGWPILSGTADFHLSRVSPPNPDGSVSVAGILPIDEWCVGSGCGCETPGVKDDAQMNAVTKLSLLKAAKAAEVLGLVSPHTQLWQTVGDAVVLLFNATRGHHDQFTSPTCPDGWGGSHYESSHTVCPADVELLTYPLGDALNVSAEVAYADAQLFIPITCQENAGMTTPIHTIVWLQIAQTLAGADSAALQDLATAEFNRSMHAACYGPFHVRNEVDEHADIVGGHFNNSRFLTGDGGFLQSVVNGYGGLRLVDEGLKLLPPVLPDSVGAFTLRGLSWHGRLFNLTVDAAAATLALDPSAAQPGLAVYGAGGMGTCQALAPGTSLGLSLGGGNAFAWPALVKEGACSGGGEGGV